GRAVPITTGRRDVTEGAKLSPDPFPMQKETVSMFSSDALAIDPERAVEAIESAVRRQVAELRRRGVVVGLSGGIDSSVVTSLCARAPGPERVQGLLMPERASSPESRALGTLLANQLGTPVLVEDIAPVLDAAGCYARQDEAIRTMFPEYGEGWRNKI